MLFVVLDVEINSGGRQLPSQQFSPIPQSSSLCPGGFNVNLNDKVLIDTMTGSCRFSDRLLIKKETSVVQKLSQTH